MKGRQVQQDTLMRCGDAYGYALWVNAYRVDLKEEPNAVGWDAYQRWLSARPPCGHKKCAARRAKERAHNKNSDTGRG